jgi:hypothetical protein
LAAVTDPIQIAAIGVAAALLAVVLGLVIRGKLREEYAFVWLIGSGALVVVAVWRRSLDIAARWLGVYYPPAVLLLAVILAVFCTALYFSVVISRQRQQIERLVEEVALLDAEVRERAADPGGRSGAIPGAEIVDAAAGQSGRAG